MTPDQREQLAQDLARAWRSGEVIPLPPAERAPVSRIEAYAVQDRMAELIGGRVAGWKVGAAIPAVQRFEGHDGPLPGRIFADRLFDSVARIPARMLAAVKVECEFAFRLAQDIAPSDCPLTLDRLAEQLVFHPAIELSASRYAPGTGNRAATTFDGIADNGSGGAAVIGAAVEAWRRRDFSEVAIEARIDDGPPLQVYGGAYRRDPVAIMAETLTDLSARGVVLTAGMVVLTGSLTLPTVLRRGQTLAVCFADRPKLSVTLE